MVLTDILSVSELNRDQEELSLVSDMDEEVDSNENISDTNLNIISSVVVYGTDWTTETIKNQLVRGNIELNPNFQRRDAWSLRKKSRLIESLILGLPVPQIVLAERENMKGKYIVLDGKQRLLSIFQFYGESSSNYDNFKLKDLEILKEINGLSYTDLRRQGDLQDSLDNQFIRTIIIRNWQKESLLYKIFTRLNTENTPLSPQELRQSLYPGGFTDFLNDQSANSSGLKFFF